MTATSLTFVPLLPWAWIATVGVLALAVLAIGLWRRVRGGLFRLGLVAVLLLTLSGPTLIAEQRQTQRDLALIIRDVSPSQSLGTRHAAADADVAALRRKLQGLSGLDLRALDAGGEPHAFNEDPGTRLFDAANRALADVPPARVAAVFMVTDGQVHDVPRPDMPGFSAPLHVLLTGHPGERDRRLIILRAPGYALVGKDAAIALRVEDQGSAETGDQAQVTLRRDGAEIAQLDVPVGQDVTVPVKLDHGGPSVFEIAVAPGPQELTLDNNRAVVTINGVRDRLHVLLISGEPYSGERGWRSLLKSDPSVDLVHFTILRPPEKQDQTPMSEMSLIVFPVHELFQEKLRQFDLVIFDRYHHGGLLLLQYLENIADYVRDGGALLEVDAPTPDGRGLSLVDTPMGSVLPAVPGGASIDQGFHATVTALGRRHPVTADLPGAGDPKGVPGWGRWFHQIDASVREGDVVMSGAGGAPLLVLDHVGKGRVAQLLSDDVWLWQRGYEGGGPQAELLRRLAYWLMKEPDLEENDLRATVTGGSLTIRRRTLHPDGDTVTIMAPDGGMTRLSMPEDASGRATATLPVTESGLYRISDGTRTALAAAGALNPREFAEVITTPDKLAPISDATGGGVFWAGTGTFLPEIREIHGAGSYAGTGWMGLRRGGDYTVTGVDETPLLPPVAAFILAGGLLALAWWREGR